MFWSKLSIGVKLFIAIMTTTGVVIAFVAIMITVSMRSGFQEYILQTELDNFQPVIETLIERHDEENPGWPEFKQSRDALNRLVRDSLPPLSAGAPLASPSGAKGPPPSFDKPPKRNSEPGKRPSGAKRNGPPRDPLRLATRFAIFGPDKQYLAGAPVEIENSTIRAIIGKDNADEDQLLGYVAFAKPKVAEPGQLGGSRNIFFLDQMKALALTIILALAASALAAFLLARQITKPVARLVSGTKRLSRGEYDLRLEKTSNDEFGHLVDQFNMLAEKLNAAEIAERQWMSDTSHELQTPLAVLRAEIEALQDGVRTADETTLSTLHKSVTRLSALVKDISQLSHAREGRLVVNWSKENISELVSDAAQRARGLIEQSGLTLELDIKDNIVAECDHLRIGQLLDNVLQNAGRYTSAPGKILLSATQQDDKAIIRVEDSNNVPSDETMERLFERFYRADGSRARNSGGSGLGLAICKLIIQAHMGDIKAEKSDLGGLAMIISLPLIREKQ